MELVICLDSKNGIGKDNTLPWYYKEDLKRFAKITKGENKAIIMGYNTWKSLSKVCLPGRYNIVITSNHYDSVIAVAKRNDKLLGYNNLQKAIEWCNNNQIKSYLIGGASLIKSVLDDNYFPSVVRLTKIGKDYSCDIKLDTLPKILDKYYQLVNRYKAETSELEFLDYGLLSNKR